MAYRQDLFLSVLKDLRAGKTQEELSEKLNTLVQECRKTGKKGSLTLTITLTPDKGDSGQYFLKDKVVDDIPQMDRGQTLMWGTPEGNLQRTDPAQGDLDLRIADKPQAAKTVSQPEQPPKFVS